MRILMYPLTLLRQIKRVCDFADVGHFYNPSIFMNAPIPSNKHISALVFFMLCTGSTTAALSLDSYSPNSHHRYTNHADFIGASYDWSGTGREDGGVHWATMISSTHFLSAYHYFPSLGSTIKFHENNDPSGTTISRMVSSITRVGGTDLVVGKLNSAPGATIAIYSVASNTTTTGGFASSVYADREAFVVGRDSGTGTESFRVGRNLLDGLESNTEGGSTGDIITFDDDSLGDAGFLGADEAFLQSGDSGGSLFVTSGSDLVLTGIHWTILPDGGPTYSGSTFVPNYIPEINTILAGSGESLTLINVPEPSAVMLLALGGLSLLWKRR